MRALNIGAGSPPDPVPSSGGVVARAQRSKSQHVWLVLAGLLIVAGTVGSVLVARSVARNEAAKSHERLRSSAVHIAETLQLAIHRDQDLLTSAGGFIAGNPTASNTQFLQWSQAVGALKRYPDLQGFGVMVIVPAAELPAFAARVQRDPPGLLAADGTLQVIPAGKRPYYCLIAVSQVRNPKAAMPAGIDYCAPKSATVQTVVLKARDSGKSSYLPFQTGAVTLMALQTPVYRGGGVPATLHARRAAYLGSTGLTLAPKVVLDDALRGHPGFAVTLRYRDGLSDVVFRDGKAPNRAQSVVVNLHNGGWTVRTYGLVVSGGVFANRTASALLLGGILLSVVLGAMLLVLATGRARAWRLAAELHHQTLHDALTGLPNRALITDRTEQLLARNRRNGTEGAALFIDLDEFKNVNDTLGHEAGDKLLVAVAARLKSTLRDADTIGRMGGDEFVVLVDGGELKAEPQLVAERLLDVMHQPFELDGTRMPLFVNASIGIAVGDRESPGRLLRDADVALYESKAARKSGYSIFYPEMQAEISHRIELEFDLRSAFENDEFRLVYQPIYKLDDLTLIGVEALVRWDHPTQGLVQPDDFIPILERNGQILEVGRWVLREACEQMAAWHAEGNTLDVSVNISGRQLDSDEIVDHIRDALESSGLPATSLIVEVTETALMHDADKTARRLRAVKELGVRIAVDDFGTGYSSLSYLQKFPVDCLKIDRSFTNAISTSPQSKALIGTLIQLGKDLGLVTLAEGIETTDQIDQLRDENVHEAQGFLLSRPLDPHTFETQLLVPTRPGSQHSTRP